MPVHDMVILTGDYNAIIGMQMKGEEGIVGKHVLPNERSNNGSSFVSFCEVNNLAIASTMFPHRDIHKYT